MLVLVLITIGIAGYAALNALVGSAGSGSVFDATPGLDSGRIPYPYQSFIAGHVTVVPDPLGGGHNVMKYTINDGDRPYSGASNPRGDFETAGYFTNGSDLYSSIRFLLPASFPNIVSSGFFQIMEIYGPPHGGSPTIGIDLFPGAGGRPVVSLQRDAAHGYDRPWSSASPVDATWHTITVHSVMSASASVGLVQLWYDGVAQTFTNGSQTINYATLGASNGGGPNILNVNSYRRAGAYPGDVTMYHGPAMVGPTFASVQSGAVTTSSSTSTSTSSSTSSTSTTTSSTTSSGTTAASFTTLPSPSAVGVSTTFDASASTCATSPCTYRFFDKSNNTTLGTSQTSAFTFKYVGTKKVTLTVTDATGTKSTIGHDLVVNAVLTKSGKAQIASLHHKHRKHHKRHRKHHRATANAISIYNVPKGVR